MKGRDHDKNNDVDVIVIGQQYERSYGYNGEFYPSSEIRINKDDINCIDIYTADGINTVSLDEVEIAENPTLKYNAYIIDDINKKNLGYCKHSTKVFDFTGETQSTITDFSDTVVENNEY